jgi:hypothetical protein
LAICRELLRAREIGEAKMGIVAEEAGPVFGIDPEFAKHYFTENLSYRLTDEHLAGWREYGRLCHKNGLCGVPGQLRFYER